MVEPFLTLAERATERWTAPAAIPATLERLAAVAGGLAEHPEHRRAALRTLALSASTDEHFAVLEEVAA